MKNLKSFNQSSSYRKFVNQRDEALERILHNTRLRIASQLNGAFNASLELIQRNYKLVSTFYHPQPIKTRLSALEQKINQVFEQYATKIAIEVINQRRKAYTLAHAGEIEALSQSMNKKLKTPTARHNFQWAYDEPFEDGSKVLTKIDVWFNRLRRVMINELEVSIMMNDPVEKTLGRIILKLPKKRQIDQARKLKKVPKKIKEAEKPIEFEFIDDETLDQIVKDYLEEYVPTDRSPEAIFDAVNPYNDETIREDIPSDEAFYAWEIEKDTTHDFVKQVRDGQVDAANENGIDDFVVIAILDNKTCEDCCGDDLGCATFNGMFTSEIEKMTKGEYDVPPYHFNCRCTLAPSTKDLEAYDSSPTERDFDEWLRPNG